MKERWHWQRSQGMQSLILLWKAVFTCRWRNWWSKLIVVGPSPVLVAGWGSGSWGCGTGPCWNLFYRSLRTWRGGILGGDEFEQVQKPAKGTKITTKTAPYLTNSKWHNSCPEWFHCVPEVWSHQRISPTATSLCFLSAKCFSTYWPEMVWKANIWSLFIHRTFLRYAFSILAHLQ